MTSSPACERAPYCAILNGDRDWPQEALAGDARWEYGIPPKAESELAWAQHALAHLRPGGRAVMLMPPAVASRPSGRRIRTEFLRRGALRAVASLPPGAARPSHIPLQLWILERPQGPGPSDPLVLLADLAEAPGAAAAGTKADWQQVQDSHARSLAHFQRRNGRAGQRRGWR